MRYIEPPHLILRKALIQGMRISSFARDIGMFLAETLFGTSSLSLEGTAFREKVAHWSQNVGLCALTEQVIFSDPYRECPLNHWTSPQLDEFAAYIRNDHDLKLAAAYHKSIFLSSTQALLHADLHTGSVMVKEGSTFVIDPEFAFYGPMGFDIGAILSNLFLSYFSKSETADNEYAEWILSQIVLLHDTFVQRFLELWSTAVSKAEFKGELFKSDIYSGDLLVKAQHEFLKNVWRDSVGFVGMKMIRRIVGIAHVADLESITDGDSRSKCEKRSLWFARKLVLSSYFNDMSATGCDIRGLVQFSRTVYASPAPESL